MSQSQVERMLTMVPFLQKHHGVKVSEVAQVFDITEKQVLADLNRLWMCGLPGGLPGDLIEIDMEAVTGEGTITLDNADYLTRPMRFTVDEAATLIVALQTVRELASGRVREAADTALAKLAKLTTGASEEQLSRHVAISVETGDDDVLAVINAAIDDRRQLRLDYDGAVRGETTYPVIDPVRVVMRDGVAYLQAWSHDREDWRLYRLGRIANAQLLDTSADDHGDPPLLGEEWFDDLTADSEVVLELDASAAWVSEYYPTRTVENLDDGRIRVVFVVSDSAWLTALLLRLGKNVRSVSPGQAADEAVSQAREALSLYEQLDRTFPG